MITRKTLSNAIRILSIDAIEKAKSGHPGAPMGMADIAEVLWRDFLVHNPNDPNWINRDRFVLSNGHASMLLYSLLHLTGYNLSIEDLKNFRKLGSKTPGHPEYKLTPGVETTTGPLGQGIANAVGFAIAEKILSEQFNKKNYSIIDHYTYSFVGDGCLMEGISHEVCSLAGALKLGKLIVFYDKNGISIDGKTENWFSEDVFKRFESYHWHVIKPIDGHNHEEIKKAIKISKKIKNKPSLIICNTIIGFGSPNKSGSEKIHGSPLGELEVKNVRKFLNWPYEPFKIPKEIYNLWNAKEKGQYKQNLWNKKLLLYKKNFPKLYNELIRRTKKVLPKNWKNSINEFIKNLQIKIDSISTRQASKVIIEKITNLLPELIGGSADLTPSNLTKSSLSKPIHKNPSGNYIHYGVREFGMSAIMNGIALYGSFIPYGGTFLIFSEYAKNAIRMASLMKIHVIFVYTHDSIGVGEDGPTHQPIEQLTSLRIIPNIIVWRPCDQIETAIAWKTSIENNKNPSILIFSRQELKQQKRTFEQIKNIKKGAYILRDSKTFPKLILIATGSEVELAVKCQKKLEKQGYPIRVVSMPSTNMFDKQNLLYQELVLPSTIKKRIVIEAANSNFWYKYIGEKGKIIGINTFGKSAPGKILFKEFNFCTKNIISVIKSMLKIKS